MSPKAMGFEGYTDQRILALRRSNVTSVTRGGGVQFPDKKRYVALNGPLWPFQLWRCIHDLVDMYITNIWNYRSKIKGFSPYFIIIITWLHVIIICDINMRYWHLIIWFASDITTVKTYFSVARRRWMRVRRYSRLRTRSEDATTARSRSSRT